MQAEILMRNTGFEVAPPCAVDGNWRDCQQVNYWQPRVNYKATIGQLLSNYSWAQRVNYWATFRELVVATIGQDTLAETEN